jgi:hypothetical protein
MYKISMKERMREKTVPFVVAFDHVWIEKHFGEHFPVAKSRNRNEAGKCNDDVRKHRVYKDRKE